MPIKWLYRAIVNFKKWKTYFMKMFLSLQNLQDLPAAVAEGTHTIRVFLLF
jgi:hypothetical protein